MPNSRNKKKKRFGDLGRQKFSFPSKKRQETGRRDAPQVPRPEEARRLKKTKKALIKNPRNKEIVK